MMELYEAIEIVLSCLASNLSDEEIEAVERLEAFSMGTDPEVD